MQRPGLRRGWCSELRFCPRCMSRGYHSVVHQFGGIHFCPVHDCCLENRCRCCGSSNEYLIKASLLDAPFKCQIGRKPSMAHDSSPSRLTKGP